MTETQTDEHLSLVDALNMLIDSLIDGLPKNERLTQEKADEIKSAVADLMTQYREEGGVLTAVKAAEKANVAKITILKAIENNQLRARKLGNQYIITEVALKDWLSSRRKRGRQPKK